MAKKYTGAKRGRKSISPDEKKVRMTIFIEQRVIDKIGKSKCKVIAEMAVSNKFHEITIDY